MIDNPNSPEVLRYRHKIIHGLIELRRKGELFGVYVDNYVVRVQYQMWGERELLTWAEAAALVWKKPPQSVMITEDKDEMHLPKLPSAS